MTITVTRRLDPRRASSDRPRNGATVVPEWEDAELLRLVAAARDRARAR